MSDPEKLFRALRTLNNHCDNTDCEDCPIYGSCEMLFNHKPDEWDIRGLEERYEGNESRSN